MERRKRWFKITRSELIMLLESRYCFDAINDLDLTDYLNSGFIWLRAFDFPIAKGIES
jgi:hypothetical protein